MQKSLAWFEQLVIAAVPAAIAGGGRRVYPGFLQLIAFMAMNMERHRNAHRKLYDHLAARRDRRGREDQDLLRRVFRRARPDRGILSRNHRPHLPEGGARRPATSPTAAARSIPGAIRNTALLTVEGGRDDICALGQTAAAHELCRSLRPHLKRHHLQANVGHYGVFNGKRWETRDLSGGAQPDPGDGIALTTPRARFLP